MSLIILAERRDVQNVIDKEKEVWVYNILVAFGADEDILVSLPRENMSEYLNVLEMEIWDNVNGSIDIFRKKKLVAQWKVPKLKLIKEGNKFHYEIQLDEWALPFQMRKRG